MRDYDDPPRPQDIEPLAIEYRGPGEPRSFLDRDPLTVRIARRLAFAVGVGSLAAGLGYTAGFGRADEQMCLTAATLFGVGGFFVGLSVPLSRRPRG